MCLKLKGGFQFQLERFIKNHIASAVYTVCNVSSFLWYVPYTYYGKNSIKLNNHSFIPSNNSMYNPINLIQSFPWTYCTAAVQRWLTTTIIIIDVTAVRWGLFLEYNIMGCDSMRCDSTKFNGFCAPDLGGKQFNCLFLLFLRNENTSFFGWVI